LFSFRSAPGLGWLLGATHGRCPSSFSSIAPKSPSWHPLRLKQPWKKIHRNKTKINNQGYKKKEIKKESAGFSISSDGFLSPRSYNFLDGTCWRSLHDSERTYSLFPYLRNFPTVSPPLSYVGLSLVRILFIPTWASPLRRRFSFRFLLEQRSLSFYPPSCSTSARQLHLEFLFFRPA